MTMNKFCDKSLLINESEVEMKLINKLLDYLGYKDEHIKTKNSVKELAIARGHTTENYKPDYAIVVGKKPRIIIEAKDPSEPLKVWIYQPAGYSYTLNFTDPKENPVIYFVLVNGNMLNLYKWDNTEPILTMRFEDFVDGNGKFKQLTDIISLKAIEVAIAKPRVKIEQFKYTQVNPKELEGIFRACHNLIWKKEKKKPTEAFYEFAKLFFIKVTEDHRVKNLGREPEIDDFRFSVRWIEKQEGDGVENPINTVLFTNIRNELERQVRRKEKKRVFNSDEKLNMRPSTIKEVVRILEHLDLHSVEEDLNGRMFETFLVATIRGKELGQFFTPRSAVDFMVALAELKCNREHIDRVLDACCGSGGFLIAAMANMWNKISNNTSLSNTEKEKMKLDVVTKYLYGMDADKDDRLPISRIARMNMVLHGDGSNRIYWISDSLDKQIKIERGIEEELREEAEEIKKLINEGMKWDVVLTNPPFSMKYERKKPDEKEILEEYEIAKKRESGDVRSSVKSNVLFLERYRDLLKPHGKLITVIDESVLNTATEKEYRDFIRENFIIKAVISLPRNSFVNADTTVKTSILYLIKKENPSETQPDVFMAISKNIGHNDAGKKTPESNDLPKILENFRRWELG
jgi:type I restriction enzyme M protein